MNDELIKQAQELREEIDNLPEIKEYYRLKNLIENDEGLRKMREAIARESLSENLKAHNALLQEYNSHPLVANYEAAKREAKEILRTIQNILK